jgi:archaellum component FlaC
VEQQGRVYEKLANEEKGGGVMFVTKKRFNKAIKDLYQDFELALKEGFVRDLLNEYGKTHRLEGLAESVDGLQSEVDDLTTNVSGLSKQPEAVSCESCGCLVLKKNAVEGKSEVVDELEWSSQDLFDFRLKKVKKIHTPYYCKFCAPEEE